MSKIFPIQSERDLDLDSPEVVELGSKESEVYLDALSSRTTRDVFVEVYDNPSTISSLSEHMDDSIQNIKYHVEKLQESNLIEVVGTDHSENGNEMDVYAPTSEAIVFLIGSEERKSSIRDSIEGMGIFLLMASMVSVLFSYISSFESGQNDVAEVQTATDTRSDLGTSIESTDSLTTPDQKADSVFEMVIGTVEVSPGVALPVIILVSLVVGAILYRLSLSVLESNRLS